MTPVSALREDQRAAYAKGLRQLADVLEASPEAVPLPYEGNSSRITFHFLGGADPRGDMAAAARAIPCDWRKRTTEHDSGAAYFRLQGELHGLKLELVAFREAVCERVVTGTREIEVEEEVRPAETRKVVKQVETVKWVCHPVLASAPQPESPAAA